MAGIKVEFVCNSNSQVGVTVVSRYVPLKPVLLDTAYGISSVSLLQVKVWLYQLKGVEVGVHYNTSWSGNDLIVDFSRLDFYLHGNLLDEYMC